MDTPVEKIMFFLCLCVVMYAFIYDISDKIYSFHITINDIYIHSRLRTYKVNIRIIVFNFN